MPETMKNDEKIKISPAFEEAARIRFAKKDYGSIHDYFPYDDMSYMQMIYVKTKRLVNLADQNRMGTEPNNESIEDNIIDLINYASYYWEFRKGVLDE
jgi:hypothetical protein